MVAAECIKLAGMQEELRGAPLEKDAHSDSSKTKNCESTVCHLENIRPQHHIYLTSSRVAVEITLLHCLSSAFADANYYDP